MDSAYVAGRHVNRPVLVHFSERHITAQVIDDTAGKTLASVHTMESELRADKGTRANVATAAKVGKLIAERGTSKQVKRVVFDRGSYKYHGKVKALADAMRMPTERSIAYAYYGKLYELRRTRSRDIPNLQIAQRAYGPAVAADFVITSAHDGEQTKFSMTYGTHGAFAEIPLTVTYQPRWWMQVELTIDEASDALDGLCLAMIEEFERKPPVSSRTDKRSH